MAEGNNTQKFPENFTKVARRVVDSPSGGSWFVEITWPAAQGGLFSLKCQRQTSGGFRYDERVSSYKTLKHALESFAEITAE